MKKIVIVLEDWGFLVTVARKRFHKKDPRGGNKGGEGKEEKRRRRVLEAIAFCCSAFLAAAERAKITFLISILRANWFLGRTLGGPLCHFL